MHKLTISLRCFGSPVSCLLQSLDQLVGAGEFHEINANIVTLEANENKHVE